MQLITKINTLTVEEAKIYTKYKQAVNNHRYDEAQDLFHKDLAGIQKEKAMLEEHLTSKKVSAYRNGSEINIELFNIALIKFDETDKPSTWHWGKELLLNT